MERSYWNRIAQNYETEIFSVLENDKEEYVLKAIKKHSNKNHTASDLGCGIGYFTPHLASRFKSVEAIDLSKNCITKAIEHCENNHNINFQTMDLSQPTVRLTKTDFVLCVNAIITPTLKDRINMLNVVCKTVRKDGHLVLVVPSLESTLLADLRLIEWDLKTGSIKKSKAHGGVSERKGADYARIHEGVASIDNVATKHYLKEELEALLSSRGMEILDTKKIQYTWKTEFTTPPRWMKEPFPWDWLFVAKKVS